MNNPLGGKDPSGYAACKAEAKDCEQPKPIDDKKGGRDPRKGRGFGWQTAWVNPVVGNGANTSQGPKANEPKSPDQIGAPGSQNGTNRNTAGGMQDGLPGCPDCQMAQAPGNSVPGTAGVTPQGATTLSANGEKFIQSYEAVNGPDLQIYPDQAGHPTIGYGHKLTAKEIASGAYKNGITAQDAIKIFRQDAKVVESDIARLIKAPLTQHQFDAVASLIFNVGSTKFSKWNVRTELSAGNYSAGVSEFANINKVTDKTTGTQTVSKGLNRRRQAEMKIFRKGIYDYNK